MSDPRFPPKYERFKFIPIGKMAFQGDRGQGGIDMCVDVEPMARDGSSFYHPTANFNQWGSSPPYTEHELCRQMNSESHNSGAIAPQCNTEQAAIFPMAQQVGLT